jgi:hypothetical protein
MGQDLGCSPTPGRPRPANDSWIAAYCLAHRFPLATFNVKDFKDFAEYEDLNLITPMISARRASRAPQWIVMPAGHEALHVASVPDSPPVKGALHGPG